MGPSFIADIACSSLFLSAFLAQSLLLVRAAIHLEQGSTQRWMGMQMLRPPIYTRRAKQILPIITAMLGLVFGACNISLRIKDSTETEYIARILLACVELSIEVTTVTELAYFSWPTHFAPAMKIVFGGITATGIVSILLRALPRRSDLLDSLTIWVPPALSTVTVGCLLAMQVHVIWKNERSFAKNAFAVTTMASRQFSLIPHWMWTILPDQQTTTLMLQNVQVLVGIHDPRDWPGPIWRRMQRRRAGVSETGIHGEVPQSVSIEYVEEGGSTRNLVSSHRNDIQGKLWMSSM